MLRPISSKVSVQKVLLCPFNCKLSPDVAWFTVKWTQQNFFNAPLRAISSKVSVQKVLLCPLNCKLRPSEVSLASLGIEHTPQVPGNRAEVTQNHDARKAISATLSVLKWSRAMLRRRSSQVSVQKVILCPFHCKPKPSGVSLDSPELENIPQVPRNRDEVGQNNDTRKAVSAFRSVLKWSWDSTSAQKLQSERCKKFAVSISLETKVIRS